MPRILIIDDDDQFCALLTKQVRLLGYTVESANTLGEGMRKTNSFSADVVFLDVRMPDGNSLEFIPEFRNTAVRLYPVIL